MSKRKKGQTEQPTEDEELHPLQQLHGFFSHHVGRHIDKVRKGLAEWIHPEGENISDKHRSAPQHTNHNSGEEEYDDDEEDDEGGYNAHPLHSPPPSTSSPATSKSIVSTLSRPPSSTASQSSHASKSEPKMQDRPDEKALEKILNPWKLKEFEKVSPSDIFEIYKALLHKKTEWKRLEASAKKKIQSNIDIAQSNSEKFNKFIKDFITYDQKQHYETQLRSLESDERNAKDEKERRAAQKAIEKFEKEPKNQELARFSKPTHIPTLKGATLEF